MMRTFLFATIATSVLGTAAAKADSVADFGSRGQLILSADRLSPLLSYSRIKTEEPNGNSTTTSTTSLNLLWSGAPQDFYDIPRLGLDYAVAPHVTVGGSLFVTLPMSSTRSQTDNGVTTSRDYNKLNAFGVALRAGFVAPLTPRVSFWGRGGLSFSRESTSNQPQGNQNQLTTSVSQWALNLEPLFVIQAAPHFGFQLGPVIDLPLSGTQHQEFTDNNMTVSQDTNTSQLHIGLTGGLLGWF